MSRQPSTSLPVRLLRGFAMFWWDFLVGDTPELFVATLITLGVAALVSLAAHANGVAVVLLPLLVILSLTASVARAVHKTRR
jgi:hypothetical protein